MLKKILAACAIINLIAIVTTFVFHQYLPPVIPMFYGLPTSNDQLVPSVGLAIPLAVSLIALMVNFLIIKFTKDTFLAKILVGVSLLNISLAAITTVNIFTLVGKI